MLNFVIFVNIRKIFLEFGWSLVKDELGGWGCAWGIHDLSISKILVTALHVCMFDYTLLSVILMFANITGFVA